MTLLEMVREAMLNAAANGYNFDQFDARCIAVDLMDCDADIAALDPSVEDVVDAVRTVTGRVE